MSTHEITGKVRELKELQHLADELAAMMEAIKDEIKAYMTEENTEELIVDVFKVRWTPVKSSRFDTAAFKATHTDLYGQYCRETVTRRFSVA